MEGGWQRASYDLRFEEGTVVGTIQDSSGVVTPVERDIPDGILLREMKDLAFGLLVAEPLIGRKSPADAAARVPEYQRTTHRPAILWRIVGYSG